MDCIAIGTSMIIYAISDEIHQIFVLGRAGMITDVGIDAIGVKKFTLHIISSDGIIMPKQ